MGANVEAMLEFFREATDLLTRFESLRKERAGLERTHADEIKRLLAKIEEITTVGQQQLDDLNAQLKLKDAALAQLRDRADAAWCPQHELTRKELDAMCPGCLLRELNRERKKSQELDAINIGLNRRIDGLEARRVPEYGIELDAAQTEHVRIRSENARRVDDLLFNLRNTTQTCVYWQDKCTAEQERATALEVKLKKYGDLESQLESYKQLWKSHYNREIAAFEREKQGWFIQHLNEEADDLRAVILELENQLAELRKERIKNEP